MKTFIAHGDIHGTTGFVPYEDAETPTHYLHMASKHDTAQAALADAIEAGYTNVTVLEIVKGEFE